MPKGRQLHDHYFKKAKEEGYVARSAYKLQEINQRKRLFGPGDRVLDLGCAPGSWLQVAGEIVASGRGRPGRVVGIDLKPIEAPMPSAVATMVGDVYKTDAFVLRSLGAESPGSPDAPPPPYFDCVLSDMAPNTAGDASDHFLSVRLCDRVLDLLPGLLRPGGNLAMKVFEGEAYPDLLKRTVGLFREAKGFKPKASRDVSREMYIVGHGYKGPAPQIR